MARWQSGASERLRLTALALFEAHGFDGVTVAEIADAAGLTERTFFRYFADKREVLFTDQEDFERLFLEGIDAASGSGAMALATAALERAAAFFPEDRRSWSRARQRVIGAHAALQERELLKLSSLAATMATVLMGRGIAEIPAALAAESAVAVFRTAFAGWIAEGEERPFAEIQSAVLAELCSLVAEDRPAS